MYITPKRKYREHLHDIEFFSDFLGRTPKVPKSKVKTANGARLNFKPLSLNDTIKRMKQQYLQVIYLIRD